MKARTPYLSPPSAGSQFATGTLRTMPSDMARITKNQTFVIADDAFDTSKQKKSPGSILVRGIRIALLLLVFITILLLSLAYFFPETLAYYAPFLGRLNPFSAHPPSRILTAPPSLFSTEYETTLLLMPDERPGFLTDLEQIMRQKEADGTTRRIIIGRINVNESEITKAVPMTLTDFFFFWRISPPPRFLENIEEPFMSFVTFHDHQSTFGLAMRIKDMDHTVGDMRLWENTLARDLDPFLFQNYPDPGLASVFINRSYRNIDWRFLPLAVQQDLGIGYAFFPAQRLLIITFRENAMERVIDRLFLLNTTA
ncbi:MAG: hypothetical protein G01um101466_482 [Parcubacteria group bacterium Gr01-1014_66]|nr:MAG: hypothetical protein G01um101466_482 [Parcubacteria group bacterium Gr01-1014_66]